MGELRSVEGACRGDLLGAVRLIYSPCVLVRCLVPTTRNGAVTFEEWQVSRAIEPRVGTWGKQSANFQEPTNLLVCHVSACRTTSIRQRRRLLPRSSTTNSSSRPPRRAAGVGSEMCLPNRAEAVVAYVLAST